MPSRDLFLLFHLANVYVVVHSFTAKHTGIVSLSSRPILPRISSSTRRHAFHPKSNTDNLFFDPFDTRSQNWLEREEKINSVKDDHPIRNVMAPLTAAAIATLTTSPQAATALEDISSPTSQFNPANFRPVCATSDTFYRFLQGTAETVVGPENFNEYGPLIAGGLLRVRLELCVIESYFNEAIGPFIQKNGYSWVLPLHETVETFLAGTIFAFATTFILVGSTKIVTVLITYADIFVGGPLRLLGGFTFDRAMGKPVSLDIGIGKFKKRIVGPPDVKKDEDGDKGWFLDGLEAKKIPLVLLTGSVKTVGDTSKFVREVTEAIDLFVGRYLVIIATGYIGFKFLHFKIFPDFPPF